MKKVFYWSMVLIGQMLIVWGFYLAAAIILLEGMVGLLYVLGGLATVGIFGTIGVLLGKWIFRKWL